MKRRLNRIFGWVALLAGAVLFGSSVDSLAEPTRAQIAASKSQVITRAREFCANARHFLNNPRIQSGSFFVSVEAELKSLRVQMEIYKRYFHEEENQKKQDLADASSDLIELGERLKVLAGSIAFRKNKNSAGRAVQDPSDAHAPLLDELEHIESRIPQIESHLPRTRRVIALPPTSQFAQHPKHKQCKLRSDLILKIGGRDPFSDVLNFKGRSRFIVNLSRNPLFEGETEVQSDLPDVNPPNVQNTSQITNSPLNRRPSTEDPHQPSPINESASNLNFRSPLSTAVQSDDSGPSNMVPTDKSPTNKSRNGVSRNGVSRNDVSRTDMGSSFMMQGNITPGDKSPNATSASDQTQHNLSPTKSQIDIPQNIIISNTDSPSDEVRPKEKVRPKKDLKNVVQKKPIETDLNVSDVAEEDIGQGYQKKIPFPAGKPKKITIDDFKPKDVGKTTSTVPSHDKSPPIYQPKTAAKSAPANDLTILSLEDQAFLNSKKPEIPAKQPNEHGDKGKRLSGWVWNESNNPNKKKEQEAAAEPRDLTHGDFAQTMNPSAQKLSTVAEKNVTGQVLEKAPLPAVEQKSNTAPTQNPNIPPTRVLISPAEGSLFRYPHPPSNLSNGTNLVVVPVVTSKDNKKNPRIMPNRINRPPTITNVQPNQVHTGPSIQGNNGPRNDFPDTEFINGYIQQGKGATITVAPEVPQQTFSKTSQKTTPRDSLLHRIFGKKKLTDEQKRQKELELQAEALENYRASFSETAFSTKPKSNPKK